MELELLRANLLRTLVPVPGAPATVVPLFLDEGRQAALHPLIAAGVESVELTSGHGQLTLQIRDPHVELGDPA